MPVESEDRTLGLRRPGLSFRLEEEAVTTRVRVEREWETSEGRTKTRRIGARPAIDLLPVAAGGEWEVRRW